ncbi:hypothetical protein Goklo_005022 [Gossypium klotzschianum]|uniref:Uncharacterized protein n=1 Tax=Gossypium klotzschianum TaxID=34286 RepID=A0A7J8VR63_9ROSI|nr:hypothetical protein [Gossypium klotzschianum]
MIQFSRLRGEPYLKAYLYHGGKVIDSWKWNVIMLS